MSISHDPSSMVCHHGLRRQTIVQSLVNDIFQGRLVAGQHLVTQDLADRFGVSHTPVREALISMAGIGVIDLVPNRGAVVRQVTTKDVLEVCQVRRTLECEAVRQACRRIDRAELENMASELRDLAGVSRHSAAKFLERARALDSHLHDLIASSCGNAFLAKELDRLKTLFRAFRDMAYNHYERLNDLRRLAEEAVEHLAIVEAMLAGDAKGAARAMTRHIRMGAKYMTRSLPRP